MKGKKIPFGNILEPIDLGRIVRERMKAQKLRVADLAGIAGVGNRLIVELRKGKPTLQLGKALLILSWLGIELVAQERSDE